MIPHYRIPCRGYQDLSRTRESNPQTLAFHPATRQPYHRGRQTDKQKSINLHFIYFFSFKHLVAKLLFACSTSQTDLQFWFVGCRVGRAIFHAPHCVVHAPKTGVQRIVSVTHTSIRGRPISMRCSSVVFFRVYLVVTVRLAKVRLLSVSVLRFHV